MPNRDAISGRKLQVSSILIEKQFPFGGLASTPLKRLLCYLTVPLASSGVATQQVFQIAWQGPCNNALPLTCAVGLISFVS